MRPHSPSQPVPQSAYHGRHRPPHPAARVAAALRRPRIAGAVAAGVLAVTGAGFVTTGAAGAAVLGIASPEAVPGAPIAQQVEAAGYADKLHAAAMRRADVAAAKAKAAAAAKAKALAKKRKEAAERAAREKARKALLARAQSNPRSMGQLLAAQLYGWGGSQFSCLDSLWTKESNWKYAADNPTSSAYGIPQALPGSKMAKFGSDWATNPATQIKWGLWYISSRYGSPCSAWSHSQAANWY